MFRSHSELCSEAAVDVFKIQKSQRMCSEVSVDVFRSHRNIRSFLLLLLSLFPFVLILYFRKNYTSLHTIIIYRVRRRIRRGGGCLTWVPPPCFLEYAPFTHYFSLAPFINICVQKNIYVNSLCSSPP
jgi:hypothetical protein